MGRDVVVKVGPIHHWSRAGEGPIGSGKPELPKGLWNGIPREETIHPTHSAWSLGLRDWMLKV
jgi:hypothetical protein